MEKNKEKQRRPDLSIETNTHIYTYIHVNIKTQSKDCKCSVLLSVGFNNSEIINKSYVFSLQIIFKKKSNCRILAIVLQIYFIFIHVYFIFWRRFLYCRYIVKPFRWWFHLSSAHTCWKTYQIIRRVRTRTVNKKNSDSQIVAGGPAPGPRTTYLQTERRRFYFLVLFVLICSAWIGWSPG